MLHAAAASAKVALLDGGRPSLESHVSPVPSMVTTMKDGREGGGQVRVGISDSGHHHLLCSICGNPFNEWN